MVSVLGAAERWGAKPQYTLCFHVGESQWQEMLSVALS